MSDLDAAIERLGRALDAAEAAVGRALDAADAARAREQELLAFADDRFRLANLLDGSAAQAEAAQAGRKQVTDEIGRRIDVAVAAVEKVLAEGRG